MIRITAWFVAAAAVVGAGGGQAPARLAPGVAIEQPIAAGDRLSFSFTVNRGDGVKVVVDQLGADVAVDLAMSGAATATADEREKHRYGRELLVWPAPAAGTVVVTVRGQTVLPTGGRFRLLTTVFPDDDRVADAIGAFNQARRLTHTSGDALTRAAAAWQSAVDAWRAIGDVEMLAASLDGLGELQEHDLRTPADAVVTNTEAARLFEQLGLKTELFFVFETLGNAQLILGQIDRGLATFEHAYDVCDDIDPINRGLAARNIVRAAQEIGDIDRAATFGERAVAALRAADAPREEMTTLEQLAIAYTRMHRNEEALALAERDVALSRKYGSDRDRATALLVVGRVQGAAGDYDAALTAYEQALALYGPTEANRYVAATSAAALYTKRGEPQRARDLLEPMFESVPRQMRDIWAAMANQLGNAFTSQGEANRAVPLQQQALEVVLAGQSRTGQLTVLRDLATTYRALGDLATSNETLDRAEKVGGEAPGDAFAAVLLQERARNARAAADYTTAARYLNQALAMVDSERGRLQSDAFRSSFGVTQSGYYADAIDVEMRSHAAAPSEGHDARAFDLFERSRARSLSDLMAERSVDIRSDLDPALMAEQRDLQRQLGIKDTAVRDLAATPKGRERAAALERDIGDIERRLTIVDASIRAANPRYAALARPEPATLEAAQHLLDDATVLVAISLGADASWGWAVTSHSARAFALPPAATVESLARQVYGDLTARQDARRRSPEQIALVDRDLRKHAAALSDAILGPIAVPLETDWRSRRLAIVTSGALQYIPFAALPSPHRSGSSATADAWLIDRHELVQLPSMSVLAELRREIVPARRTGHRVAVLADPVYAADDPRVSRATGPKRGPAADPVPAPPASGNLTRGLADAGTRAGFGRLVFSREEANAISALAMQPRVFEALDFEASVRTMKGPQVAAASIVHIASHGILNSARPELSGLALSMIDRNGRPTDGILHLFDILNLKLSADFVVLSGCETGLGRAIEGEGLVGLSRAFMYAGVPRVITSLWQVDDRATADLMRRFYRGVLVDGLRPAASLAAAQRQMRRDPRWQSPYYWAAFTQIGDWR